MRMRWNVRATLADFWRHYPALLYGIATLIGSSWAIYSLWTPILCILVTVVCLPLFSLGRQHREARLRIFLALLVGIASYSLAATRYQFPEHVPLKGGIADVEITSVSAAKTPFGNVWNYEGFLKAFTYDGRVAAKGFFIRMSIPNEAHLSRQSAGLRYQFEANLKETSQGGYALVPVRGIPWLPIEHLSSLTEWRYAAKSGLQDYLQSSIADPHVSAFLSGIVTGEFDDRLLAFELGRFGLQHLMAISGLHFSILAAIFGFTFCLFFSRKTAGMLLLVCMTAYFIFLGNSPSVTRAWMAICLALGALFMQRHSLALNSLGIAIIVVILWDPMAVQDIGFQFSFGVTAAILLWFSPCDHLLQGIFPKRRLSQTVGMDLWDQHGYCLLHFFRQSLALGFAVNIVALPLTLYHFHKFPLMGFFYNLFFPPLVSISLLLLILACGLALLVPWLSNLLHAVNEAYTQTLLSFTFNLPKTYDTLILRTNNLPLEGLILFLATVLFLGALCRHRLSQREMNEAWMV